MKVVRIPKVQILIVNTIRCNETNGREVICHNNSWIQKRGFCRIASVKEYTGVFQIADHFDVKMKTISFPYKNIYIHRK
jgi:hypothetical protein